MVTPLEEQVDTLLQDPSLSRKELLNTLWQQAQQSALTQFSYYMDTLGAIGAYELIPDLIQEFKLEREQEKRYKLISAVITAAHASSQESNDESNTERIQAILAAQHFARDLLQNEPDPSTLRHTIAHAVSILPKDFKNYEIIVNSINRLQEQPIVEQHLSNERKCLLLLSIAFLQIVQCKHGYYHSFLLYRWVIRSLFF